MADEIVVLKMFRESGAEGRVSAETEATEETKEVYCKSYQT